MGKRSKSLNGLTRRFAAVALLALLLRAMLPAGYMPDTRGLAEGRFLITLCTGQGAKLVDATELFGHNPFAPAEPADEETAPDCPFAPVAQAAALVAPPAASVPVRPLPQLSTSRPVFVSPGRGLAAPPPPSHAPPQFLT